MDLIAVENSHAGKEERKNERKGETNGKVKGETETTKAKASWALTLQRRQRRLSKWMLWKIVRMSSAALLLRLAGRLRLAGETRW